MVCCSLTNSIRLGAGLHLGWGWMFRKFIWKLISQCCVFFFFFCFIIWFHVCGTERPMMMVGPQSVWHKTWHTAENMCLCIVPRCIFPLKLDLVSSMCCLRDSDVFLVLCLVLIFSLQWWCGLKEKDDRTWSICFTLLRCFVCVCVLLAGFRLRVRSGNQKVQARWVAYFVHVHDSINCS